MVRPAALTPDCCKCNLAGARRTTLKKRESHGKVATQNHRPKGHRPTAAGLPGRRCGMTQNPKGNVVAMGDHLKAKGRLSRQQSAQMISDCRSLAVERMG